MGQEEIFRKELAELLRLGKSQGNQLSEEQVKEAFPDSGIDETKISYIYEYLMQNKIAVDAAFDPDEAMSMEDKDFLAMFLEELAALPKPTEEDKRAIILSAMEDDANAQARLVEIFLPKVAEIARLYAGQGVLMEDLIGEGNVALAAAVSMISCVEKPEDAEGFFAGLIMDAMEVLVSTEADEQEIDGKILEQVNRVAMAAEELYADLRRKVTPEELAAETDLTVGEIEEAFRLSGNLIDTLEMPAQKQ
jgi:RNA polymerase primary sigma factor